MDEITLNKISRYGAFGVAFQNNCILLTKKKSGPYKGLWGLPGGAIEHGETPEFALKREFMEEVAMSAHQLVLLNVVTSNCEYEKNNEIIGFHHIGIIYKVGNVTPMPSLTPEEEFIWANPLDIQTNELTPFAKQMFLELKLK